MEGRWECRQSSSQKTTKLNKKRTTAVHSSDKRSVHSAHSGCNSDSSLLSLTPTVTHCRHLLLTEHETAVYMQHNTSTAEKINKAPMPKSACTVLCRLVLWVLLCKGSNSGLKHFCRLPSCCSASARNRKYPTTRMFETVNVNKIHFFIFHIC